MGDGGTSQVLIGGVFLLLALSVVVVLIVVARHTRGPALPYAEVAKPGYALRRLWFAVVLTTAAAAVVASLFLLPYPSGAQLAHAQEVRVVAHQYYWQLSTTTFHVGQSINFAVTSADVNHGFGLYDPDGVLLGQVQAMPDYVNHLVVTFRTPGTYILRCMEYCGQMHHVMEITLVVKR